MNDKDHHIARLRRLLEHIAPSDEATATIEGAIDYIELLQIANRSLMWMIANPPEPKAPDTGP